MAIIVTLALFLLIFFILRKNSGAAILAVIAGLATYKMFGADLAATIHGWTLSMEQWAIDTIIYFALILIFPMLLYFRSGRGGLFGILRLAQTIVFALFLTALLAHPLAEIFNFDELSRTIASAIVSFQGPIVAAGLAGAYIDILFFRSED